MRRRDALVTVGGALSVTVSGCLGLDSGTDGGDANGTEEAGGSESVSDSTNSPDSGDATGSSDGDGTDEPESGDVTDSLDSDGTDAPDSGDGAGRSMAETLGVSHLDGRYHHSDDPFLQEGTDVIAELGTNVCKVWLDFPSWYYPYNSDWQEKYGSMVSVAQEPGYRELFEGPFSTYVLKATANHRYPPNYFRDGMSDWDIEQERERFAALTEHLLRTYDGSGATFVLQDVEGDGWAAPEKNPSYQLPVSTIDAMQEWYRARQAGVERGRAGVESDVTVLHAAEVNVVLDAKQRDASRVVNKVLPAVDLDLVSYSAWELGGQIAGDSWLPGQNSREQFDEAETLVTETLDYIVGQFTPTGAADDVLGADQRPLYLGELGVPFEETGPEAGLRELRAVLEPSLEWGVRWAIYWQVYCNELASGDDPAIGETVSDDQEVRGFYLVKPDGSKAVTWDYFRELLAQE